MTPRWWVSNCLVWMCVGVHALLWSGVLWVGEDLVYTWGLGGYFLSGTIKGMVFIFLLAGVCSGNCLHMAKLIND